MIELTSRGKKLPLMFMKLIFHMFNHLFGHKVAIFIQDLALEGLLNTLRDLDEQLERFDWIS